MQNELNLQKLFFNMKCSQCESDFDEKSFTVLHKEKDTLVLTLKCSKCLKDFGIVFLQNEDIQTNEVAPLIFEHTPKLITKDEVIEAHIFLKNLDSNWQKHIPNDFIEK